MAGRSNARSQDPDALAATRAFMAEVDHARRQRNQGNKYLPGEGTAYLRGATQALRQYREAQQMRAGAPSAIRVPRSAGSATGPTNRA